MPRTDLGVPKPQGPVVPTLGGYLQNQQARTRAFNQASIDEFNRYTGNKQQRELQQEIEAERMRRINDEIARQGYIVSNQQFYESTYQTLQGMLEGRRPWDLKQAVFLTENAFMNGGLNYAQFSTDIHELTQLCRGLAADSARPDLAARFMALHRLMTDTIRVTYAGKLALVHVPPRYDFKDFWGREDYTKQFVNKLLATNSGQCHSLPLLYKLVADELGIKSYLSMAPSHSYIQVKDNRGVLYSYETTRGFFVSDSYYMSSGFIKAGALKNRSYLDTLTRRETMACRMFDLARSYAWRYGHDAFTTKCVALGLRYYPQSVQGRMLAHDAALMALLVAVNANGHPSEAQARLNPKLRPLMEEVKRRRRAVEELGHEEMPTDQYARWLKQVEQEQNRLAGQQAASRFEQSAKK